ncbi:MAG TPA: CBASS oligonucleotide cyclase [Streptosporangiaceae bacterium]|nr:CBASS oligonucleotide cyclase [Streptosporangiaceae bacterium]
MGYVDDAFANLRATLEITRTESRLAIRRHHGIRDEVREEWDIDDDFLTGSYRRDTKTKKLKDVDIFVVVDSAGAQAPLRTRPPRAILDALAEVLRRHHDEVTVDRMACTVSFGSDEEIMSFDVVPAFKRTGAGGGYEIPDTVRDGWIATNPKRHHELSTAKNKACDEKFVPFVKMIKGINRELGDPVTPSFLLEVMAQDLVKEPFGRYQDEVRWFLATAAEAVYDPWPDPAGLGPDVNAMTTAQRDRAEEALTGALAIAEEAVRLEDDGQERAAVEQWRRLFAWRMPRP